ncbi:hypothetical protein C8A05DRAFT_35602 [Staphylotrichum tortipilum]|uniref:Uncharacterized protein n=1 Tax=Staphylotrichum tortipilum TaxID=2831512 RepID=A0AAN6RRH8_9PEZI|nr:hypothetical protein C8A05DRAFT_35602 [Staphylotrichum longicolle]
MPTPTPARLVNYLGSVSLKNLPANYQKAVAAVSKAMENKYPKVTDAKIQGSTPHKSHKDKSDAKDVITVSYHTAKGTRITSVHAHEDSTYNEFPSRNASKGK